MTRVDASEQWWAIVRAADGELVSVGTRVADPLPEGLAVLPLDHEPDWSVERWNPVGRCCEPAPAEPARVSPIDAMNADPAIQALPPADRAMIAEKLAEYFGAGTGDAGARPRSSEP